MTPPKRKPRKVVTDATKAKLPKPKRKPKGKVAALRKAFEEHRAETDAPLTASDILAIREKAKAEYESRAIPCGEDAHRIKAWYERPYTSASSDTLAHVVWPTHDMLPLTEPFPWPVRVLNWLDAAPAKARRKLAAWLRALAGRLDA